MVALAPRDLFARALERWPEREAVRADGAALSYRELDEGAEPFALAPGTRVAILSAGGVHALQSYAAVQAGGGVAVELNPTLPDPELEQVLAIARPEGALADEAHRERLAALWERALGSAPAWLEARGAPSPRPEGDSLASLVFTSGTTGTPKGVQLSHANLAAVSDAIARSFGLDPSAEDGWPDEAFLASLPLYYTYGRSVVPLAFAGGARLVFTTRALTPKRVLTICREETISHLSLVPYQALALLRKPEFSAAELPALRRITVAGGALPTEQLTELARRFPGSVYPMYGLTEAATRLTCLRPSELSARPRSCGRAIAGVELAIADAAGAHLPAGQEGEVLARGPNVTAGYFGDEVGSRELFRAGWLRTGDLGALDADGYLTIRGRLKDLIKVMGERVAAKSLEDLALESPEVLEAAAIGVPDEERGEAVLLYVVCAGELDEAAIAARIATRLGRAKVPRRIEVLDALPKTGSGKVRKALLRERARG